MIKTFYFTVIITINAVSAILFFDSITITPLSSIPFLLSILMLYEAVFLRKRRTKEEQNLVTVEFPNDMRNVYTSVSLMLFCFTPLQIPFILFFPSLFKLFSLLVYALAIVTGILVFKVKTACKKRKLSKSP